MKRSKGYTRSRTRVRSRSQTRVRNRSRSRTRSRSQTRSRSRSRDIFENPENLENLENPEKDYLDDMITIAEYIAEHNMQGWDLNFIRKPSSEWKTLTRHWTRFSQLHPDLTNRLVRLADYLDGTVLRNSIPDILKWLIDGIPHMNQLDTIAQLKSLKEHREELEHLLKTNMDPYAPRRFRLRYSPDDLWSRSEELRTKLVLIERLQRRVLNDAYTLRRQIGPSRDPSRIIRAMAGQGEEYKYPDFHEEKLNSLLLSVKHLHEKGYTAQDLLRGIYPEILQQYRELESIIPSDFNLRERVEDEFRELDAKEMEKLLHHIRLLAKDGMTLEEFQNGFGQAWEKCIPDTVDWIKKTYARYQGNPDLENKIQEILTLHTKNRETRLLQRIPRLVENGIDFTGLMYGLDATALEWFNTIRHLPGTQARIKKAFEQARQNLINEFLNRVRTVSIVIPHLSYEGFLQSHAHELFQSRAEAERFEFLFQTVSQYPDYSSIEKQMRSYFQGR